MREQRTFLLRVLAGCALFVGIAAPAARAQGSMAGMDMAKPAAAPSTSLTLTIDGKATVLALSDLQALPQKTITVHNEHTKTEESYAGVALGDLLAKYGLPVDRSTHQRMLRSYLKAEGSDKYWVLYSVTEIEASEHAGDVIVATSIGGSPLAADGQFKLVASGDKRPQRWVRNLAAITVVKAE